MSRRVRSMALPEDNVSQVENIVEFEALEASLGNIGPPQSSGSNDVVNNRASASLREPILIGKAQHLNTDVLEVQDYKNISTNESSLGSSFSFFRRGKSSGPLESSLGGNSGFSPVELDTKALFDENDTEDFFDIGFALSVLTVQKSKKLFISNLTLSGIEQLTDMVFLVLRCQEVDLKSLEEITLSGAPYVTDQGIQWLSEIPGVRARKIFIEGCPKLTDRSLHALLGMKPESISMKAVPNLSCLGPDVSQKNVSFSGCQLISPLDTMLQTVPCPVGKDKKLALEDYNFTKIVVIHEENKEIGKWMFTEEAQKPGDLFSVKKAWMPDSKTQQKYNLFECVAGTGCENWVLSNGCIVVLPFSDVDDKTAKKIAKQILSIIAEYPESVFVLGNLNKDGSEEKIKKMVEKILEDWLTHNAFNSLTYRGKEDMAVIKKYNFQAQTEVGIGQTLLRNVQTLLSNKTKHLISSTPSASSPTLLTTDLKKSKESFLQPATDTLRNIFPWHCTRFYQETISVFDAIMGGQFPTIISPLEVFKDTKVFPAEVLKQIDPDSGSVGMNKAMDVLHTQGNCLYFPHIDKKPMVQDIAKLPSLTNLGSKAPRLTDIPWLGQDIPSWRKEDFYKNRFSTGKEAQRNTFLEILLDMGMIFRFPWPMKDPKFADPLIYVMTNDLPDSPAAPLDEVWTPGLPEGEQQRDVYFTFPSLPQLFFPCFQRRLQETSQLMLLWKSGLVLYQGPVMVLVELLTNEINKDLPTISISARVVNSSMIDSLTVTFNNITTILTGMLISKKIYASKTVCCQVCNPTRDRRLAVSASKNCCHMSEFQFNHLSEKDSQIVCKKSKKGFIITKEEFATINSVTLNRQSLVPNHMDMTNLVQSDYRMDGAAPLTVQRNTQLTTSLRCHLCNNCAAGGINCGTNRDPGITHRHCMCQHKLSLCSYCGVCPHCIKVLTDAHSLVQPCFKSKQSGGSPEIQKSTCILEFTNDKKYTYEFPFILSMCYCRVVSMVILSDTANLSVLLTKTHKKIKYTSTLPKCKIGDQLEFTLVGKKIGVSFTSNIYVKKNDRQVYSLSTDQHPLTLTLTADTKDGDIKFLVSAPHWMPMGKVDDAEKSLGIVHCCPAFPTKPERQMTMMYASMEELMMKRIKQFSGSAGVLLPKSLSVNNILYPTMALVKDRESQLYYPTCSLNLTEIEADRWPPVNYIHLVNGDGIPASEYEKTKLPDYLIWCTHVILSHYKKVDLPPFDQLFAELAPAHVKDLPKNFMSYGVQRILRMAAIYMAVSFGEELGAESWSKKAPSTGSLSSLLKRSNKCGLKVKDGAFLCPGHVACLEPEVNLSEFQTNVFQGYKPFISQIVKSNNHLETIQKTAFEDLPNLCKFSLPENFLEVVPDTIVKCRFLKELCLADNDLLELPSALYSCTELTHLDISNNRMVKLPSALAHMGNLQVLRLNNLLLKSLPDTIGHLQRLKELSLNGNCLTVLPKTMKNLKSLTKLSLTGIKWMDNKTNLLLSKENFVTFLESEGIKRWINANPEVMGEEDMFKLFDLDKSGTLDTHEIAKVNASLFSIFPRLGYIGTDPPDDQSLPFGGVPEEIFGMRSLVELDLSYQGIISIPDDIKKLINLQKLHLNSNPNLLSISAEIGRCPLTELGLDDCPVLKTPPKEIRDRGFRTTYAYLKRLLTGSTDCKRTKLMLVGLGGAGKTSLVKSLMSKNKKSTLTGADSITDGIDICTWDVKHNNDTISYSVWDFAGQTIYYNTHQFFLSDRAVYLLLWNIRLGHEHAGLNFWLNSITVHAPKAPIFVVGTHTDQMTKVELPMDEMKLKYHQIEGFHFVSSKDGKGIPELKEALFKVTLQQEYMGEKIPQAWLQLEKVITEQRNKSKVLDFKTVETKAVDLGIVDSSEISQAVQFLHDLGMIQHFSNEYLRDHVIIEPQWIVDVMACVVCVDQAVIKDGRLQHADIKKIWKDYTAMADWLLRLTEEFDLTFQLEGAKCNIVPCLLPEKCPDFTWPEVKQDEGVFETKMIYKFDYLPGGLFNRGQVRLHGISEESVIWKRGSFIKKNGQLALVQQIGESLLHVKVQGPRPDNLLFFIHEVFESLIKESFSGVAYDCKIPCPDCVNQYVKDPHMFKESGVRRAMELKAPFLQCHKYFHTSPVLSLQGILAPDNSKDYEVHLNNDVTALKQMQNEMAVDIFISYCAKDAPKDRSKVIHPADVYADLENEGYTCYFPQGKDLSSREEMAQRLVHASVFLVFISNNYAADTVCCDMYKYAVNTMKKMTICVTVGENFNWQGSTTLGVFISDVIFVNMTNSKKSVYKSKFDELLTALQKNEQLIVGKQDTRSNACFISYAWVNSHQAVELGSKKKEGALGSGDPREIKTFLEKNNIPCWIDIEQINVNDQLFYRLFKGLSESRIMVACVSDEYAASENCCKEIRFAVQLKVPIVVAVVGTGNTWKCSEVGFHANAFPTVDFQEPSDIAHSRLLSLIKEHMLPESQKDAEEKKRKIELANAAKAQISFQEMFELAQRKFLREISRYASEQDIDIYPRLFAIDIMARPSKEASEVSKDDADTPRSYSIYTLCECEQGWHSVADPVLLTPSQESGVWQADPTKYQDETMDINDFASYLARITLVMEHNPEFVLRLHNDTEGQEFITQIEELALNNNTDFQTSYHKLRKRVFELDTEKERGKLKRCRLPSGKIVWLCEEHSTKLKVLVLSEESGEVKLKAANQPWLDAMLDCLRVEQKPPFEFKENKKSKRRAQAKPEKVQDIERELRRSMSRSASTLGGEKLALAVASVKFENHPTPKKHGDTNTTQVALSLEKEGPSQTKEIQKSVKQQVTKEPKNISLEAKKSNDIKIEPDQPTSDVQGSGQKSVQYVEPKPSVDQPTSDVQGSGQKSVQYVEPKPSVDQPTSNVQVNGQNSVQVQTKRNNDAPTQKPKRAQVPPKSKAETPPQSKTCVLS
ncbi:uncharacterized protein LOC117334433 [Pecten maximus]|uniref:uncharacterized protein LOC117334433 n=1 Tax=Pecten maximus TaxID=6579 RepID=UPI00145877B7|nr:uncharacterized protein LOC117334433 [Pecten maximus]